MFIDPRPTLGSTGLRSVGSTRSEYWVWYFSACKYYLWVSPIVSWTIWAPYFGYLIITSGSDSLFILYFYDGFLLLIRLPVFLHLLLTFGFSVVPIWYHLNIARLSSLLKYSLIDFSCTSTWLDIILLLLYNYISLYLSWWWFISNIYFTLHIFLTTSSSLLVLSFLVIILLCYITFRFHI